MKRNTIIYEECASCVRLIIFQTEQARFEAMTEYSGEILCDQCRSLVTENA